MAILQQYTQKQLEEIEAFGESLEKNISQEILNRMESNLRKANPNWTDKQIDNHIQSLLLSPKELEEKALAEQQELEEMNFEDDGEDEIESREERHIKSESKFMEKIKFQTDNYGFYKPEIAPGFFQSLLEPFEKFYSTIKGGFNSFWSWFSQPQSMQIANNADDEFAIIGASEKDDLLDNASTEDSENNSEIENTLDQTVYYSAKGDDIEDEELIAEDKFLNDMSTEDNESTEGNEGKFDFDIKKPMLNFNDINSAKENGWIWDAKNIFNKSDYLDMKIYNKASDFDNPFKQEELKLIADHYNTDEKFHSMTELPD